MGGSPTQTQTTQQQTAQSALQSASTRPWESTLPQLQGLLGQLAGINAGPSGAETGALGQLSALGGAGNPYAGGIGNVANTLLSGGGPDRTPIAMDAYNAINARLAPTASGDYLDPTKNPFFSATTDAISRDVEQRLRNLYAGSGRDPSQAGNYGYNVARGVGEATAPVYAGVYNQERGNQLAAANALFGAGGQTTGLLSGLDQARLGNMQAGIGAAGAANEATQYGPLLQLAVEAQRRGIPLQALTTQFGLISPLAQAFGTTSGTSSGTGSLTGTQTTRQDIPLFDKLLAAAAAGAGAYGKFK